ncbi:MAG: MFS transporter [Cyanobacteria bacterium REEB67]|nr:MFS transporter [Cyanobacteria bacterium REEB67]
MGESDRSEPVLPTVSAAAAGGNDQVSIVEKKSFSNLSRGQLIGTIVGLQLALLLAALDQTIVATAMPRIIAQLNGFDRYAWVTTAYLLTSTASGPIFARISDIYGRKWVLLGAAIFFLFASFLCGASGQMPLEIPGCNVDGMSQLIIFRGMQGIGGGVIMAIVFSAIGDIFPPAERGKYMGLFAGVWGLASMIGPTLGGWLTDHWSWRWIFYVNLPVGLVAIAVLYFAFLYIKPHGVQRKIDYWGALTLVGFLVPLLLGLTFGNSEGWTSARVIGLLFASATIFVAFAIIERRVAEPIIPPRLLAIRDIRLAIAILFCASISMFDVILFAPLFLQSVLGVGATEAGVLFASLTLTMSIASASSGQLISRFGHYKLIASVGLSGIAAGLFFLSQLDTTSNALALVALLALTGLGLGLVMPVFTLTIQNAAPQNMIGAATALSQFCRSIGATLGAAIMGAILQLRYMESLKGVILERSVPAEIASALSNPARLSEIKLILAAAYGESATGRETVVYLIEHIKTSLVFALNGVFMLGALVALLGLIINFFVEEKKLRSR